jgi:hypothetical protein
VPGCRFFKVVVYNGYTGSDDNQADFIQRRYEIFFVHMKALNTYVDLYQDLFIRPIDQGTDEFE